MAMSAAVKNFLKPGSTEEIAPPSTSTTAMSAAVKNFLKPGSTEEIDALIVGGGPVGLTLAIGLCQKGLKVIVLEAEEDLVQDWSRSYAYRLDCRGVSCFDHLGLKSALVSRGVRRDNFAATMWEADGKFIERPSVGGAGNEGYWLLRPILLQMLREELPSGVLVFGRLEGRVPAPAHDDGQDLSDEAKPIHMEGRGRIRAEVILSNGARQRFSTQFLFGCDGFHSLVRRSLGPSFAMDNAIATPSSGMIFKAMLYTPPKSLVPGNFYIIKSKSQDSLSMLPVGFNPGEPRPVMKSRYPSDPWMQLATPAQVYSKIRTDFPQLKADCFDEASVHAACEGKGTIFPEAKWAQRAALVVENGGVVLLGDALHTFPPDLGQGVNAGLVDVERLLSLWPQDITSQSQVRHCLEAYETTQLKEAEAICRLIPIGYPYQYRQPMSCAKLIFMSGFLLRVLCFKMLPCLFYPPVVFGIQESPPKKYSDILRQHQQNTRTLGVIGIIAAAGLLALSKRIFRDKH